MTRAIGAIRVSTDEQSETGVSLAAQEAKIRAYCDLYGIELVRIVVDAGLSGKSLDRPGIQDALAGLDRGEADGIVVAKLDRLSRSVGDWDYLIANFFGEKAGCQLWSVAEAIDTRTSAGRLVLNILMSVAQWEREAIAERTRDALNHKRNRGERVSGRLPYGYELAPDGTMLRPCHAEQAVLSIIRELRGAGMTLVAIAAELNRRGLQRREGGNWEHTFISRILKKAA
jgi:DNA invertase Pin-like site-specific DNA recombinase